MFLKFVLRCSKMFLKFVLKLSLSFFSQVSTWAAAAGAAPWSVTALSVLTRFLLCSFVRSCSVVLMDVLMVFLWFRMVFLSVLRL